MTAMVMTACTGQQSDTASQNSDKEFNYVVDQFADLEILRYKVPGFESLSLRQKQLLYHLSEAALMGRDIFFDQNGRYNLAIRRTLEASIQGFGNLFETGVVLQWYPSSLCVGQVCPGVFS